MDRIEQFFELIDKEMTAILATAQVDSVTMRIVSPVRCDGGVLFFTDSSSIKYTQLKANPNCSIAVGLFFAECTAELRGATMLECNTPLRDAYCGKFPGAFDEGLLFGGRNCDFVLLRPKKIKGWAYENDEASNDGVPSICFEVDIPK